MAFFTQSMQAVADSGGDKAPFLSASTLSDSILKIIRESPGGWQRSRLQHLTDNGGLVHESCSTMHNIRTAAARLVDVGPSTSRRVSMGSEREQQKEPPCLWSKANQGVLDTPEK